ncbi:MAG: AmmeMemoRadiSam system protein B, partial [candidate division Zixibacteria bacterium]|nr:AmmeMemoRadiSam system protein B [candidate division Zixibacteria bacterium]
MDQSIDKIAKGANAANAARVPAAAGRMYPAEPAALTRSLSELFASVKRRVFARPPLLLIAPHSALEKSGAVAASVYSSLLGQKYDVVVIIAPSHSGHFPGVSVFSGESYETPLGTIPVDTSLVSGLGDLSPAVFSSTKEHIGGDHGKE